jgi:hypothetical protein
MGDMPQLRSPKTMTPAALEANRRNAQKAGRPSGPTHEAMLLRKRAAKYGQEALDYFVVVMRNKKEPTIVRMNAANHILDRGYGKPGIPETGVGLSMHVTVITGVPRAESKLMDKVIENEQVQRP